MLFGALAACKQASGPSYDIIVPDDVSTIQAAIDASVDGDTVLVRAGTYSENIVFPTDRSITVLSALGPASTTIDGGGTDTVVKFPPSSEVSELNGFTITNGDYAGFDKGGGIDIYQCSPVIADCIIIGNSSYFGGGIRCDGASPTITGCTISGNSAVFSGNGSGGGMYNTNSSTPTLSNCTFEGNAVDYQGGGMYNINSSPILSGCTFSGNTAIAGGGMYDDGSSPILSDCTFSENTAPTGGGMYNSGSSPTVRKCSFLKNWASQGGGMYNVGSSPTVTNCRFYRNLGAGSNGIEMRNVTCPSLTVTNCTFLTNGSWWMYNENSSPTVTNCILWGDLGEPIKNVGSSSPVVSYCDVIFGYAGTGNINSDPKFVDGVNGDLHLQASSPCIDAGDNSAPSLPTIDIDGDSRRIDDPSVDDTGSGTPPIVDMGADEFGG